MELTAAEHDLFSAYLSSFGGLTGDRRTRTLFEATVRGIIGAESLCCNRIAAFSPVVAEGASGEASCENSGHRGVGRSVAPARRER